MFSVGLPSIVRLRSGQLCSPFEAGALPVLRPARRIHIRLRGRVLCNPPRLKGFRSAGGPDRDRAWHPLVEFVALRVPSASLPFHTAMLPRLSLAIRVVMLRRRNTGSLPHSRLSAQSANRIPACHSAQRSATLPASSLHVKPIQATSTVTNQPTRLKASAKQAAKLSLSDST